MTWDAPHFIRSICSLCYPHLFPWAGTMPFVRSTERGGSGICSLHAVIRMMLISLVLMLSSNLACNQCFISSTAVVKDTPQSSSLQHNQRIHPDLESLLSSSPLHNCFWIFISFQLDANDTSRNTLRHLEKVKQISHLNETKNFVSCCGFHKKIPLHQTWKT